MSRKEKMEALLGNLQTDLSLSTEQSTRVRTLVMGHMEQRQALKQEHGDNKAARKAAVKPLNKQLRQEIGGVLDAGQAETFKANKDTYRKMLRG